MLAYEPWHTHVSDWLLAHISASLGYHAVKEECLAGLPPSPTQHWPSHGLSLKGENGRKYFTL